MNLPVTQVIGHPVTALSFNTQIETILDWAQARVSKVVCVANVHMLMEASWHLEFGSILQRADIVTPDGMPLVWMMRLLGFSHQDRVAGLDILINTCQQAEAAGVSVYFLGSQAFILDRIKTRLVQEFPELQIAGMEPLPFRPLTITEDEALIERINRSGAGIVWVALGCPKQEYWMTAHKHRIQAVMVGLGGAFAVYAGIHQRAPLWMRNLGLEWLYRLMQEPQRLFNRYATTIPPFVYLALKQLLAEQLFHPPLQKQSSLK